MNLLRSQHRVVWLQTNQCGCGPLLASMDVSKHSVDLLAVSGLFTHPPASHAHVLLASTVFRQSISGSTGDTLFHKKADHLKILESTFDLESSICCLSIILPEMNISLVNFILANEGTLGHFFVQVYTYLQSKRKHHLCWWIIFCSAISHFIWTREPLPFNSLTACEGTCHFNF